VGSTSDAQVVTVTLGGAPATVSPIITGAGFAMSGTTCANPQPAGACTVMVIFAPVAIGSAAGVLTIGVASVALSGVGVSGRFSVPDLIGLGTVQLNQTVPVVIPIDVLSAATMTCAASGADLSLTSQTCPLSGLISGPCTFTFWFKASTAGTKNESVVCSAGGQTTVTIVTATVVAPASPVIDPASAKLTAAIGNIDTATFTLANAGGSPTGYFTVAITAGANDFAILSNECTGSLSPLATCKIQVGFEPNTAGAKIGTLTVTDQTSGQTAVATLTATAVDVVSMPIIKPASEDFGNVTVGKTKTTSFTVTNTGSVASGVLDFASDNVQFTVDPQTCTGLSIAPAGQCTFAVTFAPASAGTKSATIVATRSGTAVGTVRLTGAGVVPDAGPSDLAPNYAPCFHCGPFAATPVGQTSAEVICTSEGSPPDGGITAMHPQVSGVDFAIVGESCTTSSCTVTLVFTPTDQGRRVGSISASNLDRGIGCSSDFVATGL
jgi:hypothetical protein